MNPEYRGMTAEQIYEGLKQLRSGEEKEEMPDDNETQSHGGRPRGGGRNGAEDASAREIPGVPEKPGGVLMHRIPPSRKRNGKSP